MPSAPVSTPETPVHTEPAAPAAPPEIPTQPEVQPSVTPMRAEESAPADTYPQEKPLRPKTGEKVRRADYRPAGVTPVHVVELHDYAEVILKEAKTYPKASAKLHTAPLPKVEEAAAELAKEEEVSKAESPAVEEPTLPVWEPLTTDQEGQPADTFLHADGPETEEEETPPPPKKKKKFSIMGEEEPDVYKRQLFLRPGARRDDGLDRHGQQPDGWRDRRMRCCCVRGLQIIGTGHRRFRQPDSSQ